MTTVALSDLKVGDFIWLLLINKPYDVDIIKIARCEVKEFFAHSSAMVEFCCDGRAYYINHNDMKDKVFNTKSDAIKCLISKLETQQDELNRQSDVVNVCEDEEEFSKALMELAKLETNRSI